jgi:CheY-like chemotaxis protein
MSSNGNLGLGSSSRLSRLGDSELRCEGKTAPLLGPLLHNWELITVTHQSSHCSSPRTDLDWGTMTQKILLVEDSRYQRMANKRVLTEAGFEVLEATDGEEALRKVQENPPDLVILDILLPRLGGEQVLYALRQDPATEGIPVIVFSSLPRSNSERLKEAGATAYVEKSQLDPAKNGEAFVRLVNAALRQKKP